MPFKPQPRVTSVTCKSSAWQARRLHMHQSCKACKILSKQQCSEAFEAAVSPSSWSWWCFVSSHRLASFGHVFMMRMWQASLLLACLSVAYATSFPRMLLGGEGEQQQAATVSAALPLARTQSSSRCNLRYSTLKPRASARGAQDVPTDNSNQGAYSSGQANTNNNLQVQSASLSTQALEASTEAVELAVSVNNTTRISHLGHKTLPGVTPSAWCRRPKYHVAGSTENYTSCVIFGTTIEEEALGVGPNAQCSISWIKTTDTRAQIAVSAAHCFSHANGTWLLNLDEVNICCAYEQDKPCPPHATYNITEVRVLNSYHKRGSDAHDLAVLKTTKSFTGQSPSFKWEVNNWDPTPGALNYTVYGYPQKDERFNGCENITFSGKRVSYNMKQPVIQQPPSEGPTGDQAGPLLWGDNCGGLSGGPVVDGKRNAVTSVVSLAGGACFENGYGKMWTAAIMGWPREFGGKPGLTDVKAGVDVWCLKEGW